MITNKENANINNCSNCGKELDRGARFCIYCGGKTYKSKNFKKIMISLLASLVLVTIVFGYQKFYLQYIQAQEIKEILARDGIKEDSWPEIQDKILKIHNIMGQKTPTHKSLIVRIFVNGIKQNNLSIDKIYNDYLYGYYKLNGNADIVAYDFLFISQLLNHKDCESECKFTHMVDDLAYLINNDASRKQKSNLSSNLKIGCTKWTRNDQLSLGILINAYKKNGLLVNFSEADAARVIQREFIRNSEQSSKLKEIWLDALQQTKQDLANSDFDYESGLEKNLEKKIILSFANNINDQIDRLDELFAIFINESIPEQILARLKSSNDTSLDKVNEKYEELSEKEDPPYINQEIPNESYKNESMYLVIAGSYQTKEEADKKHEEFASYLGAGEDTFTVHLSDHFDGLKKGYWVIVEGVETREGAFDEASWTARGGFKPYVKQVTKLCNEKIAIMDK